MCQAISQGGRRCPAHRHDTQNIIKAIMSVNQDTVASKEMLYSAFKELRKIHRGIALDAERYTAVVVARRNFLNDLEDQQASGAENEESFSEFDNEPADATTLKAQFELLKNATTLVPIFTQDRMSRYLHDDEDFFPAFNYFYKNTQECEGDNVEKAHRILRDTLLKNDMKAVKAIAAIIEGRAYSVSSEDTQRDSENEVEYESSPRVTLVGVASPHSPVLQAGYDPADTSRPSHLSLVLKDDLNTVLHYKNVTEEEWENIRAGGSRAATAVYHIRTGSAYRYASIDEAEEAAVTYSARRCDDCGRYKGASAHVCPSETLLPQIQASVANRLQNALEDDFNPSHDEPENEADRTSATPEESAAVSTDVGQWDTDFGTATVVTPLDAIPESRTFNSETPESADEQKLPTVSEIAGLQGWKSVSFSISGQDCTTIKALPKKLLSDESRKSLESDIEDLDDNDIILYKTHPSKDESLYSFVGFYTPPADHTVIKAAYSQYNRNSMLISTRPAGQVENERNLGLPELDLTEGVMLPTNETRSTTFSPTDTYTLSRRIINPLIHHATRQRRERSYLEAQIPAGTDRGTRDAWKFPGARDLRRELGAGNKVIAPFSYYFNAHASVTRTRMWARDAFDYEVDVSRTGNVSGYVMLEKDSNGSINVVGAQNLRCDCPKFVMNRYCTHLGYAVRQTPALAHNIMAPRDAAAQTSNREPGSLPVTVARVAQQRTDENGNKNITFSEMGIDERTYWDDDNALAAPTKMRTFTADTRFTEAEQSNMLLVVRNYKLPKRALIARAIKHAGKNGTTSVPVDIRYARVNVGLSTSQYELSRRDELVTGTVKFGQDDEGNTVIKHRTLRCTCPEYREDYDCMHIRRAALGMTSYAKVPAATRNTYTMENVETDNVALNDAIINHNRVAYIQGRAAVLGEEIPSHEEALATYQEEQDNPSLGDVRDNRYDAELEEARIRTIAARNVAERRQYEPQRERMAQRFQQFGGPSYVENPEAFDAVVAEAVRKHKRDEEVVPFRTENATNGICADVEGGRSFGVELEFVIEAGRDRGQALAKIGKALKEAGLTTTSGINPYHSGAQSNWGSWTLEEDVTVDGELVSPLMKDSPEDWEQLKKACDILRTHGATVSHKTGSHVHMSTGSLDSSVAKHAELIRTVKEHEDVLYRLGSDTKLGTHRGTAYCAPNIYPEDGLRATSQQRGMNDIVHARSHDAINLGSSGQAENLSKSHAEFRLWDASLDPAIIQQQVMLSAAITEYADQKISQSGGVLEPQDKNKQSLLGSHKDSGSDDTSNVRQMLDKLFPREEDRQSMASLFAITKWQRNIVGGLGFTLDDL